jgi:gamma-glutamylcyclotransferase (GGCT)/AIG2-like uncharacterized protein YtfP
MTPGTLFAYGTLMDDDIMVEVAGATFPRMPGTIIGYNRYLIKGETYPGLVAEEGSRVEGVVYRNVSAAAWVRLDLFEGEAYEKVEVAVCCGNDILPAAAYLLRSCFTGFLEKSVWDYPEFLRKGKQLFQNRYSGFASVRDRMEP